MNVDPGKVRVAGAGFAPREVEPAVGGSGPEPAGISTDPISMPDDQTPLLVLPVAEALGDQVRVCVRSADDSRVDEPPLSKAIQNGNLEEVISLLDGGLDVNEFLIDRWTPLHLAANCGHLEIVKALRDRGANIHAELECGYTALHLAAAKGHADVVNELLKDGLHLKLGDLSWTPLHVAAREGCVEIVSLLLRAGIDSEAVDKNGVTAFHVAVSSGSEDLVRALVGFGVNINAKDNMGCSALYYAAKFVREDMVNYLLGLGLDINEKNSAGQSPLVAAIQSAPFAFVEFLIDKGARVESNLIKAVKFAKTTSEGKITQTEKKSKGVPNKGERAVHAKLTSVLGLLEQKKKEQTEVSGQSVVRRLVGAARSFRSMVTRNSGYQRLE